MPAVRVIASFSCIDSRENHSRTLYFNLDGCITSSRCVFVDWMPGSEGTLFISVHRDGAIVLHHKVIGSSSDSQLLHRSESQNSIREMYKLIRSSGRESILCASMSPHGPLLAIGTKDGKVKVIDLADGTIIGGFTSFFGGIMCVEWSSNGNYIAAGGEDDLIAIWNMKTGLIEAHCEGHSSWISSVAFEYCNNEETMLRLFSVGQDCKICIWQIPIDVACTLLDGRSNSQAPGKTDDGLSICPSYSDMNTITPVYCQKIHYEPLSCVKCLGSFVITCGHDGCLKAWRKRTNDKDE